MLSLDIIAKSHRICYNATTLFAKYLTAKEIMIDKEKTLGCDKISRAYCENFNALQPLFVSDENVAVLGNIQIKMDNMDVFDRAALGLYIGKFVEQEINSSVVQLMRYAIGIDMPEFFCKRDPRFRDDEVRKGKRCILLNKQNAPTERYSLATIPAGDAYYALEVLKDETDFFEDYKWLYDKAFLDAWRNLFRFRNSVAHIGHLIAQSELDEAFGWFEIFLRYMPNIKALKMELAPEDMFDDDVTEVYVKSDKQEFDTKEQKEEKTLPKATPEQYKRVQELLKLDGRTAEEQDELDQLVNGLNWMTTIFTDGNGKKGMRHADGRELIPALYEDFELTFHCIMYDMKVLPAYKGGKCGLVKCDGTGEPTTDFIYDRIYSIPWNPQVFFYTKGGSIAKGLLLADGRELCPCIIDRYYEPSSACVIFECGDYFGLYDLHDKVVMPMFDSIEVEDPFEPMIFTLNGIKGYLDMDYKFVPKSDVDAIEDEDERHDRMLDFLTSEIDYDWD